MHRSSTAYKQKQPKTVLNMSVHFDINGHRVMDFFTGESIIMKTQKQNILTAPIHCRGCISRQVM